MSKPNQRLKALLALAGTFAVGAQAADVFSPGFVKREVYTGIAGVTVDLLRAEAKYPGSPDESGFVAGIETPPNVADNYGVRLSGFITPPATGSYVFYISADDGAEFWLSTDENPANIQLICGEPVWNGEREWRTPGSNGTGRNVDAPENISPATSLTTGRRYYFEALMKEGGGGDNLAVTAAKNGDPIPANGTPPLSGSWVGSLISDAGASVQITQQPASVSVQANQNATFTVAATAVSPRSTTTVYEWRRNGVPIPGATSSSLTLNLVQASDNGAKFSVLVGVAGASVVSSEATLTVTADVIAPTIVSARATAGRKAVTVEFSEPVDQASATTAANYSLSGGVTVSAAALVNPTTVRLTTSQHADGAALTLTVNNVKDSFVPGNPVAANSTANFRAYQYFAGAVLNRFWDGFSANNITALMNLSTYPNRPDRVQFEKAFEYPADGGGEGGSNYGNLMEAWWKAPSSGDYVFFCSGDDPVWLYLSTDEDPANAKRIAVEPQWNNPRFWVGADRRTDPENRSDIYVATEWPTGNKITLTAGKEYYIRALHTEGGGGDNVGVKAVKASDGDPENGTPPIQGSEVGFYYDPTDSAVSITQQPASKETFEGRTETLTVGATGKWQLGSNLFYQWQVAPNAGGTFADIAGATSASFTTAVLAVADNGKSYRVRVYVPGAEALSSVAVLSVRADNVAPAITRVSATGPDALNVVFDEALDPASAGAAANYKLSGNITVTGATLGGDGANVVTLDLGSPIADGASYTLTVNGVKDRYNNATANATRTFTARIITYADIIRADAPIAYYRFEETGGSKAVNAGTLGPEADGLYMLGESEGTAKNAPGPIPGIGFAGFSKGNKAAVFDGENDWVNTTKQLLNGLGAFTLEYWVKPQRTNDVGEVWPNRIGIVGQNDAIEYGFINPTTIQIWTPSGGSLDTTYPFADGEWHHIATIASGRNIQNYFDGKLVGTGGGSTGNYGTSTFNVNIGGGGVFDGAGNFFRGQIDEVAIFNKAIPADRVAAHFKAGKEGGAPPEPTPSNLTVARSGGNITISWTGAGTLQSAASVLGPWSDVAGAGNPHTTAAIAAAAYYRVAGQ